MHLQVEKPEQPVGEETIVYFNPKEGDAPEILLFEEKTVRAGKWRRIASEKSKEWWARTRQKMEHFTSDMFAADRFVHRLKGLKKMTVLLNRPIEPSVVRDRIRSIFRDRSYHHLRWLIVDALLLPVSVLLVPLPGPNLVGYYLIYRVYSHWRSWRSAKNACLEQIDVHVSNEAQEVTDLLRAKDIRTALHEVHSKYGLRALQEHEFIPQRSLLKEAFRRMKISLAQEDARSAKQDAKSTH